MSAPLLTSDGVDRGADARDDLFTAPLEPQLGHDDCDQVLAAAQQGVGLDPADHRLKVAVGELVDLAPRVQVRPRTTLLATERDRWACGRCDCGGRHGCLWVVDSADGGSV